MSPDLISLLYLVAAVLFILVLAGSAAVLRGLGREAEER